MYVIRFKVYGRVTRVEVEGFYHARAVWRGLAESGAIDMLSDMPTAPDLRITVGQDSYDCSFLASHRA